VSSSKENASQVGDHNSERNLWDRGLKARRPAITEGFVMPGFAGKYWIWPEEYALLSKYVDLTKGDYLEIASMRGIIAMSLAEKNPNRQFVCVDAFLAGHGTIAGEKETFLRDLREHKLENVTLIEGDSRKVAPTLSQRFDVVFVDGNHAYEYVLGDALNSWPLPAPNGFIIFHDYECVEETTRAVKEFCRQTGAQLVEQVSSVAVACKSAEGKSSGERDAEESRSTAEATVHALQKQVEHLVQLLKTSEDGRTKLSDGKNELEAIWRAVESSASWRMLNKWRRVRDQLLPPTASAASFMTLSLGPCGGARPGEIELNGDRPVGSAQFRRIGRSARQ
jgi:precorrin-6B methylase 2